MSGIDANLRSDERAPSTGDIAAARPVLLGLLVFLAAMAVYLPSLSAEFLILDDAQYVTGNPYVMYPSGEKLAACFGEVLRPTTVLGYYQPLTMASLMLDRVIESSISGAYGREADPFVFHFTNILLHGVNAALAFGLILGLTRRPGIAVLCGLLFAVHPLNVEVVSWVSQRKALLATLFALVCVMAYARYTRKGDRGWYAAALVAYLASLLAKPTGLLLPLVFVLMDVWPLGRDVRRNLREKIPFFGLAAIGGWIAYVSQTHAVDLSGQEGHRSIFITALVACHNLVFYLAKMIVPARLCPEYLMPDESVVTLASPPFLAGLLGTGLAIAACVWAYRRKLAFAWTLPLAFLLMIGPTLTPVRFTRTIAADRFAYTPMLIALVLVAEVLRRLLARRGAGSARQFGAGAGVIVIALFGYLSVRQQSVWQNSYAYYGAVVARFPDQPSGHYGLGNAYLAEYHELAAVQAESASQERRAECLRAAFNEYRTAIETDPEYCYAYYRLGHIEILRGDLRRGIEIIEQGLATPNADPEGYLFLGLARTHAGEYALAVGPYERFLAYQPASVEARKNLANALLRSGRPADALPHFARLHALDPTDLDGLQNWGVALIMVGHPAEATERLRPVVDARTALAEHGDPARRDSAVDKLADARFTLAGALALTGDSTAALIELRNAIELKPALRRQAAASPAFEGLRGLPEWSTLIQPLEPPPTSGRGGD